jgi:NTP pyrophosphatase (non-canonical NTP hydrolase)
MHDSQTTVAALRQLVNQFVDERAWHQFHSPKNLAMSIAIEAAELMEHFQWLSVEQSRALAADKEKLAAVGEELADVLCYALAMANELGLDLSGAIERKMVKNRQKYPTQEYHGYFGPDDPNRTAEAKE